MSCRVSLLSYPCRGSAYRLSHAARHCTAGYPARWYLGWKCTAVCFPLSHTMDPPLLAAPSHPLPSPFPPSVSPASPGPRPATFGVAVLCQCRDESVSVRPVVQARLGQARRAWHTGRRRTITVAGIRGVAERRDAAARPMGYLRAHIAGRHAPLIF